MSRKVLALFCFLALCQLSAPLASAHVPLEPDENHTLETAFVVDEPTKSWALYDELHEAGEAAYYRFDLNAGEKVYAMVYTYEGSPFAPGVVVMGPGIESNDTPPDYVEVVNGTGIAVVFGSNPEEAGYEPFTPSSYYYTAEYQREVDVSGTYYVAVFDNESAGNFGIAIGYKESFTLSEWLGVPVDVIKIHLWEGQNLALVLAPLLLVVAVGMVLVILFKKRTGKGPRLLSHWLAVFSALTFFGTAGMILMQMGIALGRGPGGSLLWVTIVFAVIPLMLGLFTMLSSLSKPKELGIRTRAYMMVLGALALTFWAGLYIGPILLFAAALIPMKIQGGMGKKGENEPPRNGEGKAGQAERTTAGQPVSNEGKDLEKAADWMLGGPAPRPVQK